VESRTRDLANKGFKAVTVRMHLGYCDFKYDWNIWLACALAHGLKEEVAILGRDCYREAYGIPGMTICKKNVDGKDNGQAMLQFALKNPKAAKKRWRFLMETDGERFLKINTGQFGEAGNHAQSK